MTPAPRAVWGFVHVNLGVLLLLGLGPWLGGGVAEAQSHLLEAFPIGPVGADGTVTSSPAGIDCGADCEETYLEGTVVTLTATPGVGNIFIGWHAASDADCLDGVVGMTAPTTCYAHFDLIHPLTVVVAGTGGGTVTSVPAGIACGGDCDEIYPQGTAVTLTPTPDPDSMFVGWTGDVDCADGVVDMAAATSCTATFDLSPHQLTVALAGTGSGTVTSVPAGIACGSDCDELYAPGTTVTLTPTPAGGSTFGGWSGDADCADGVVGMAAATSCTATFDLGPQSLTVALAGTGSGTVASTPVGIDCGADCAETYAAGTVTTLTPTAAAGSVFTTWTGDAYCTDEELWVPGATLAWDQNDADADALTYRVYLDAVAQGTLQSVACDTSSLPAACTGSFPSGFAPAAGVYLLQLEADRGRRRDRSLGVRAQSATFILLS